jgi:glycerol-3-phosphate dehydrogenase (NAD(P)+)
MGTALLTPLHANGHELRLWGTERDDAIIAALAGGDPHPRLGVTLPPGTATFPSTEAAAALDGADIVVVAITSNAVRPVLARLGDLLGAPRAIVVVGKGFDAGPHGDEIRLLPDVIAEFSAAPVVAVGGPSIAREVALGIPTAATFGSADPAALAFTHAAFSTPAYFIEPTDDVAGLEVAAAMKNAYGVAIGIADGIEKRTGLPHHNMRAALFPHAVAEMGLLAESLGGRRETVAGLSGAGDLQVTVTSGRNRLLGERVGMGLSGAEAFQELSAAGTTTEGYLATDFGYRLARRAIPESEPVSRRFPVLDALYRVLYEEAPAAGIEGYAIFACLCPHPNPSPSAMGEGLLTPQSCPNDEYLPCPPSSRERESIVVLSQHQSVWLAPEPRAGGPATVPHTGSAGFHMRPSSRSMSSSGPLSAIRAFACFAMTNADTAASKESSVDAARSAISQSKFG